MAVAPTVAVVVAVMFLFCAEPQQQQSCGSEQWEQTARTTADSYNESQSSPAAVMKTERHVLASKPPRANAQQATPTSGKVALLLLRISQTLQGCFQKI